MEEQFSQFEEDNYTNGYRTEEDVEHGKKFVDERLWEKVERIGRKISFAKDIKALYRYVTDRRVGWQRKAIVVAALVYFITPLDAIPDLAPLIGYMDDVGVVTATLRFLGKELMTYYE
ncbi:MAG: YkvA family protein [bacterium]